MESKLNGGMLNTVTNPSAVLDIFNPFRQNYGASLVVLSQGKKQFGCRQMRHEISIISSSSIWVQLRSGWYSLGSSNPVHRQAACSPDGPRALTEQGWRMAGKGRWEGTRMMTCRVLSPVFVCLPFFAMTQPQPPTHSSPSPRPPPRSASEPHR